MRPLIQKTEYRQREEERRCDDPNTNHSQQRDPARVHRGLLILLAHHKPLAPLTVEPKVISAASASGASTVPRYSPRKRMSAPRPQLLPRCLLLGCSHARVLGRPTPPSTATPHPAAPHPARTQHAPQTHSESSRSPRAAARPGHEPPPTRSPRAASTRITYRARLTDAVPADPNAAYCKFGDSMNEKTDRALLNCWHRRKNYSAIQ